MRILHVLDHSLPLHSGYVFRTLGILRAQRDFGWETVHLTTPRYNAGTPAVETVDGWEFHRTARPRVPLADRPVVRELLDARAVEARLAGLIARTRPDIVHAHSPVLTGIPAWRAARRVGLPFVYEVRALWEDAAVDHGTLREGSSRYRAQRGLESWLMRRADGVVTLCEAMRGEIAGRGIAAAKITVVPNAVDLAEFDEYPARDEALAASLGLGGRVLGFIGSFYGYEGLDLLVGAMPAILEAEPEAQLLLVGGGYEDARLRAQVATLGLEKQVVFTGRVPHGEVGRYYGLIDICVYPRRSMRLTELVTPLKPLEAAAQRRIVVASDIGGHREMIEHGVTGFLFPPGEAGAVAAGVIAALRAPAEALREAARHRVARERVWSASAARYRPLYERLTAGQRNACGSPR